MDELVNSHSSDYRNAYIDLRGKVAVVTGCNGGMGLEVTRALAEVGALVVAADLQEHASESLGSIAGVTYRQTDVSSESAVVALIGAALELHGRLDCAVNAAAIEFETVRLADCDTADFDRLMRINLRGVFLCMKYQLKAMLDRGVGGSIVNLASTTSFQPGRIQPAYTTSKHAVVGLTRQAAIDYAPDGIRVNAIAPGNIDTPMLRNALARRGLEADAVEKRMPMRRFGHSHEIASAALWLCSDASSFTTGHVLTVEGGMLLG